MVLRFAFGRGKRLLCGQRVRTSSVLHAGSCVGLHSCKGFLSRLCRVSLDDMVVKTCQSVQQLLKRALYLVGLSFSLPLALIQLILDCEDLGFIFVDGSEVLCLDIKKELSKFDHVFRDLV